MVHWCAICGDPIETWGTDSFPCHACPAKRPKRLAEAHGLVIDAEFAALCPPPSRDELDHREQLLRTYGCGSVLVAWRPTKQLLYGFDDYAICERLAIPFDVAFLNFADREACKAWILMNEQRRRERPSDSAPWPPNAITIVNDPDLFAENLLGRLGVARCTQVMRALSELLDEPLAERRILEKGGQKIGPDATVSDRGQNPPSSPGIWPAEIPKKSE